MTLTGRAQSNLPSNTEINLKEQAKAIITRSGLQLPEIHVKRSSVNGETSPLVEEETMEQDEQPKESTPNGSSDNSQDKATATINPYKLPIPFSQRLRKHKMEQQNKKFLEVSKKLHINIPLADALSQMLSYAKKLDLGEAKVTTMGQLILRLGKEQISFNVFKAMKLPSESDSCFQVNVIDKSNSLEIETCAWFLETNPPYTRKRHFEELGIGTTKPLPSIQQLPVLELKQLSPHLRYAYLKESCTLPMIISNIVSEVEEEKLFRVLRENKTTIGWTIADIKGISPSLCMHKILMEENCKPSIEGQRRLNPNMKEVVRKEILGYNQKPVAPEDQEKTTFTCPYDTFAYRRMPFGLCNAPATFQRCMMAIFSNMIERFIEVFMDDFSIFRSSFDECLVHLNLVLQRYMETNLVLNWEKCHFMVQEGIVLGHRVSAKGIEVDKVKIQVIEKLPPPTSVKGVSSFLGHVGFYRRFIKDFSKITKRLCNLLMKDIHFEFNEECLTAFNTLKEKLTSAPVIVAPDWGLPFALMCKASDHAVGAILGHQRNKFFHVIYYASRTLNDAQINYSTTEKELLAVVYAFDKFRSYLVGSKVIVYTNHTAPEVSANKEGCEAEIDLMDIVAARI
ncbi:uncharacterized protein LOC111377112 [Olea europaea var. sylvestris]|uniref:uncharacterized protein LOC111377112 n=1 Tax=Olea europaea var. sylvestris TaxID=158386 RepID=UPI000C1D6A7B|nr:uncharacterized protein LOC111377112 [Olea europaea var. sylvestris]